MKNVSFYKGSNSDKALEQKRKYAEALMGQSKPKGNEIVSGMVVKQSPLEGLARALQGGLGGLVEGNANRAEDQRTDAARQTMADAISNYGRATQGGSTQLQNGEQINWNKQPLDQAGNAYAQALMGNPDTAPYGQQYQMENIDKQRALMQAQALQNIRGQPSQYQQFQMDQPQGPTANPVQPLSAAPFGHPTPKKQVPIAPQAHIVSEAPNEQFGPTQPTYGSGGLHGDKFLNTLDPAYANIVKAIGNGEAAWPTGSRMNSESRKLIQDAKQYNPKANANNVKSALKFDSGKQGDIIRSLNVAHSHLDTLGGLIDALGNGNIQAINSMSQAFNSQFGQEAPVSFDAAKRIVSDEIVKAVIGAGGALGDREEAQATLDKSNSPQQLRSVISVYQDLMRGQLDGLKLQYENSTNKDDFSDRLSPDVQEEYNKIQKIAGDSDYDALPSGSEFIDPNGKRRKKP